jgi:peptidase E
MELRLLLVSTNLAVPWLAPAVRSLVEGCGAIAVVTTAEPKLKERARNAQLACEALRAAGVARVDYFDFDRPGSDSLADFAGVCLAGGNPFYLLERLRETGGDQGIEDLAAAGRPILACGAATALLGRTLGHLREFDPSISDLGCTNPTALGLLPFSLLPQANRWRARCGDYADRLERRRRICGDIVELDDGAAIVLRGEERLDLSASLVAVPG